MFLGEFSIYGDRAAQCLAKTWLGRGNKKEKKKKEKSLFVIAEHGGDTGTATCVRQGFQLPKGQGM